jgi:hypothetical protein
MIGLLVLAVLFLRASAAENQAAAHFHKTIQPILSEYCYDCHGDGMSKGGVAFDEFKSDDALLAKRELWWAVLKNLRAGLMPPQKKARPSGEERGLLEQWIKYEAFGIDPKNPDPGRITLRRLNRVEYRNTIRDLMGIDFKADEEFPPDDTGYGFDNIGDVLTVSPLLLEKYMQAAEAIVASAVPRVAKVIQEKSIPGKEFCSVDGSTNSGDRLSFYQEANVSHALQVEPAGDYRLLVDLDVTGQFDFDPGRCSVVFRIDGQELSQEEFTWHNNKRFVIEFGERWHPGEHQMAIELHPMTASDQKRNSLDLRIVSVRVQGPLDERHWIRTKNYDRFFSRDEPPKTEAERRQYAREVLSNFTNKAFRRPVDDRTVDRLVTIAEAVYTLPRKVFEDGVGQAMVAVLASPRFLFRVEEGTPNRTVKSDSAEASEKLANAPTAPLIPSHSPLDGESVSARTNEGPGERKGAVEHPTKEQFTGASLVDEYALASRLSYFLWSTMPDEDLFRRAARGELRKNLGSEIKRMLADARSEALIQNFTGQWLQLRDVEGIDINARVVLARERDPESEGKRGAEGNQEKQGNRRKQTNRPEVELDGPLRRAMRQETEMFFGNIAHEDRSVLELIDSDYTFVNERLARHYGFPDVSGNEMRRVTIPGESARGGLLTQGSVLVVTSNPTRTSPVKRGLFILDNILGMPPPPPPANVPDLEESAKGFKDREPTLREILELHRSKPLCSSCHSRMDPLGLALENFNALGLWREKERGQPIDASGKLITGESFRDIRELKRIVASEHRLGFYRCLTEKLLTYALGRGLEYYDVHTVDQIVDRLDQETGRFSVLLMGIIESTPFQKQRDVPTVADAAPRAPSEEHVQARLQSSAIANNKIEGARR